MLLFKRTLTLLLCLALTCAGIPAHACGESQGAEIGADSHDMPANESDCPHHQAAARASTGEPGQSASGPGVDEQPVTDEDCCGLDCRCGCSAPVPALMLASATLSEAAEKRVLALLYAVNPSRSPELLLRPPQAFS